MQSTGQDRIMLKKTILPSKTWHSALILKGVPACTADTYKNGATDRSLPAITKKAVPN